MFDEELPKYEGKKIPKRFNKPKEKKIYRLKGKQPIKEIIKEN